VISLTASVAVHESLRSLRTIIVEPAAFYFLVVAQVRDRRAAFALALALVVAGVLISLVGFWQYATDQRIITAEEALRRIRGFYGSPNNLGLFLGRALPMAAGLSLWWTRGRAWLIAASIVIALALLLTFSIGAWVAVGVSLLALAALRGRRTLQVAVSVAVVGLLGVLVAALRVPRIGSHFDLSAGTSFERVLVWQSALRMLADHPIRGIGLDNFLYYYQHGYRLPAAWREPDLSHPHNLVLDFWLSLGLPGLLGLGLLVGRLATVVAREWRVSGSIERGVYAGVVGAMLDTVLHGLVDNSFFLVDLSVLFWLMFAIVAVMHRAAACRETR
jgi:putative inorganic carbon (HCO3(-)) transporter